MRSRTRFRRADRHTAASWTGHYRVDAHPELGTRSCRVIDVSMNGALLDLLSFTLDELPQGTTLMLDLVAAARPDGRIALRGEVRHAAPTEDAMHVGIEFAEMTTLDRNLLAVLLGLYAH